MPFISASSKVPFQVTAFDATIQRVCGLLSEPIGCEDIPSLKGSPIDVETSSHAQGWVNDPQKGSWSWFELAIIPAYAPVTKPDEVHYDVVKKADKPLSWIAFHHPVDQNGQFQTFKHRFPGDHEIWKYVQGGDRFAVFGCAQFPSWACYGRSVDLSTGLVLATQTKKSSADAGQDVVNGTARGTVRQITANKVRCSFSVDGTGYSFETTVSPRLPFFYCENAVLHFTKIEQINDNNYYSLKGRVGKEDIMFTLTSETANQPLSITGNLAQPIMTAHEISGAGTWSGGDL